MVVGVEGGGARWGGLARFGITTTLQSQSPTALRLILQLPASKTYKGPFRVLYLLGRDQINDLNHRYKKRFRNSSNVIRLLKQS